MNFNYQEIKGYPTGEKDPKYYALPAATKYYFMNGDVVYDISYSNNECKDGKTLDEIFGIDRESMKDLNDVVKNTYKNLPYIITLKITNKIDSKDIKYYFINLENFIKDGSTINNTAISILTCKEEKEISLIDYVIDEIKSEYKNELIKREITDLIDANELAYKIIPKWLIKDETYWDELHTFIVETTDFEKKKIDLKTFITKAEIDQPYIDRAKEKAIEAANKILIKIDKQAENLTFNLGNIS